MVVIGKQGLSDAAHKQMPNIWKVVETMHPCIWGNWGNQVCGSTPMVAINVSWSL